jgi:hypothetical protein
VTPAAAAGAAMCLPPPLANVFTLGFGFKQWGIAEKRPLDIFSSSMAIL